MVLFQSTLPRGERHVVPCNLIFDQIISIHAPARGATHPLFQIPLWLFISIHAPARGATQKQLDEREQIRISIHAPARGATMLFPVILFSIRLFQSTLPRGERQYKLTEYDKEGAISIHAPARGATKPSMQDPCRARYFNPRSREGSDSISAMIYFDAAISIHAPARGATLGNLQQGILRRISIHAPARGATKRALTVRQSPIFQSTLPRGERRCSL